MNRMMIILVVLLIAMGCSSKQEAKSPETKIPGTSLKLPEAKDKLAIPLIKIADLLDAPDLVGQTVHVKGRCLGYGSDHVIGTPPHSRSDWALEDDGNAIYVTGPFPPGCSGLEAGKDPIMLTVKVAVDTLTSYADGSKSPRYFLIAVEAP